MLGKNQIIIKRNVRLKNYTTFRIGGNADYLAEVKDNNTLVSLLTSGGFEKTKVLGKGSNVLASDKGYRGLIIVLKTESFDFESGLCIVDAGMPIAKLSKIYIDASCSGFEWACSIPGTIGGAVKMNAGAFGSCIGDVLEWVEVFRDGSVQRLENKDCGFGYRESGFAPSDTVVKAAFKTTPSDKNDLIALRKKYILFRQMTQPGGFSAGSVFKAAEKPAGWYIDNASLKGLRIGGALVSDKHANFIINAGNATSADVASLIDLIKTEIKLRFDVHLKEEIEYLGEF